MINIGSLKTLARSENKGQFIVDNLGNAIRSAKYRIYLQDDFKLYQLPINPETFKTTLSGNNDQYNVLGLGDVVKPRLPKLKEWSWDGLFMADFTDPLNIPCLIFPPSTYITVIENAMKNKKPLKFIQNSMDLIKGWVSGENVKVVIDDFKYEERGGEVGDIYYSITLREYKHFAPKMLMYLGDATDTTKLEQKVLDSGKEITKGSKITGNGKIYRALGIDNGTMEVKESIMQTSYEGVIKNIFESNGKTFAEITDGKSTWYAETDLIQVVGGGS